MVERIYDLLNCDGVLEYSMPKLEPVPLTEEHVHWIAEQIVTEVEQAGMLPPLEREHFLDRIALTIEEEHKENHGYPITDKRKYYALRGASLAVKTTWEPEDE